MSRNALPSPKEIERQAQHIVVIKLDRPSRSVQLLFDNGEAAMTRYASSSEEIAVLLTQQMAAAAGMIAIEGPRNALYLKPGRLSRLTLDGSSLIVEFHDTTTSSLDTLTIFAEAPDAAAQLRAGAIRDLAAATLPGPAKSNARH